MTGVAREARLELLNEGGRVPDGKGEGEGEVVVPEAMGVAVAGVAGVVVVVVGPAPLPAQAVRRGGADQVQRGCAAAAHCSGGGRYSALRMAQMSAAWLWASKGKRVPQVSTSYSTTPRLQMSVFSE